MSDQDKRIAIGTAGEFLMLNITLPGLDLTALDPEQTVSLKWAGGIQILLKQLSTWNIEEDDQARIVGVSCDTLMKWQSGTDADVTDDVLARCRALFRIHMAVRVLFPISHNPNYHGHHWLHTVNKHFNGLTPIQSMIENGPADVARYLFSAMQH